MARGGHHGGSTHVGSHHSSGGGFHGGGGGFHGGGYHGGYHGGGGGGDDLDNGLMNLFIYIGLVVGLAIIYIIQTAFNCFDLIKIVMLVISVILLFINMKIRGNVSAIQDLKNSKQSNSAGLYNKYYYAGNYMISDGISWYDEKNFCLVMDKRECRPANLIKVHEKLQKWPKILKTPDSVWYVASVILLIVNVFFYKLVIPAAENSVMSDEAFKFIDNFLYYIPVILILLCSIACVVLSVVRLKFTRLLCVEIIDENIAENVITDTEKEIEILHESFWYYDTCPNCGGDALSADTRCRNCGSSLKIQDIKKVDKTKRHQVVTRKIIEK